MKKLGIKSIGILLIGLLLFSVQPVAAKSNSATKFYTIKGRTITVSAKNGKDISKLLNAALKTASQKSSRKKICTVRVSKGNYPIKDVIHLYGNVRLELKGVTLKCSMSAGNMLLLGDSSINENAKKMSGYGTLQNVTVVGGTFQGNRKNTSSLIRAAHSRNVTFDGCVLTGGGCAHQMEVAAIDGFTAKNCTFRDMPGNGSGEKQEALQLDIPCGEYIFPETYLDGTPMKHIKVTGCTFENVPRGVGSHSMIVGVYFDDVTIQNNHFSNVAEEAIVCLGYRKCKVKNNVIKNCGAGVLFQYFKPNVQSVYKSIFDGKKPVDYPIAYNAHAEISGNDITITPSNEVDKSIGIKVYGYHLTKDTNAIGHGSHDLIPANNYYVSGVKVSDNKITTCGHGIQFFDVKDSSISGNTIVCNGKGEFDGIFGEFESRGIAVSGNEVINAPRYGICFQGQSSASEITANTVKTAGKYGIYLYNGSSVTGAVSGNTVSNAANAGIFLNKDSHAGSITGNHVTASGRGIYTYQNSTVQGENSGNIID